MKRIKPLMIWIASLCAMSIMTLSVSAATASVPADAPATPDLTLTAALNGSLFLGPKNVMFSNRVDLSPGDTYTCYLSLANNTDQDVEFCLENIQNMLAPTTPQFLDVLDLQIIMGGQLLYNGPATQALYTGLSPSTLSTDPVTSPDAGPVINSFGPVYSSWMSTSANQNIPVYVTFTVDPNAGNEYQGNAFGTFTLGFTFAVRSLNHTPSSTPSSAPGSSSYYNPGTTVTSEKPVTSAPISVSMGPKTGQDPVNANTVDEMMTASILLAFGALLVILLVYYKKRKDAKEQT